MKILTMSILLVGTLFAAQAAYADSNNKQWKLPRDILTTSNQISFNQGANDVWYFMESSSLVHNPATYQLLPKYSASCPGSGNLDGLACWWDTFDPTNPNAALPHVGINFNSHDVDDPGRGIWPSHTMLLHPYNTRLGIIAWRSPEALKVNITGVINSLYATLPCGDGVSWSIEQGTNVLASGDTSQASSQAAFSIKKLDVKGGEAIYFIADPKATDLCDSTEVSFTITK